MGSSTKSRIKDSESLGTLLADVGVDYMRLGEEIAASQNRKSHLQSLLIEFEDGIICVAACSGLDCLVFALAETSVAPGLLKARLKALASHVQESFSTLSE